jgi:hypothetical protein
MKSRFRDFPHFSQLRQAGVFNPASIHKLKDPVGSSDPRHRRNCLNRFATFSAQAVLSVIRAGYALVRARAALVCAARGLTKSSGERNRGRNSNGFGPATAEALSLQLQGR